ncbi:unnamed protein product [Lymnaea stagnalis]|uniref:Cupin 2 conserved barrel domain-containing protein n=1 Tax=Lymnaea stagnalis TaxID=6523 RepID=A0AAV2IPX2_LYMST
MKNDYRVERWNEKFSPDSAKLKQIMQAEGFSVFEWTDSANTIYGNHEHFEEQSHWIISGELEMTVENIGTFVLKSGDRDFMPANTVHSARVLGGNPVTYLIGAKR